jgi:hypothetical protein
MEAGLQPRSDPGVTVSEGVVVSTVQVNVADPTVALPLQEFVAITVNVLVWTQFEEEST